MTGSRNGYGLHIAAFVSRGVRWRIGRSDALGGEPQTVPDAAVQEPGPEPHDLNGAGERAQGAAEPQEPAPAGPDPQPIATPSPPTPAPLFAREGAVEAYCLELCGAAAAGITTEEVIASPRLSAPPSDVAEDELLRVTRSTASGFAPTVLHPGSIRMSIDGTHAECAFTVPRLARRANGELDRFSKTALAAHLEGCLVCRAAEARHDRAERAFAAVLGVTPAIAEPEPEPAEASSPLPPLSPLPPPEPPEPPEPEPAALMPPPAPPAAAPLAPSDQPAPLDAEQLADDLESVEDQPVPEPMRGLVVLPASAAAGQEALGAKPVGSVRRRDSLGRSTVLIATLIAGALMIVIIALLWSSGSSSPDPRSLPPVSAASSASVGAALSPVSGPHP